MLACIYIRLIRWSFLEGLGYNCTTDIEVHSFTVLHLSRINFPADDSVQIPSTIHPILGLVIIAEVRSGKPCLASKPRGSRTVFHHYIDDRIYEQRQSSCELRSKLRPFLALNTLNLGYTLLSFFFPILFKGTCVEVYFKLVKILHSKIYICICICESCP